MSHLALVVQRRLTRLYLLLAAVQSAPGVSPNLVGHSSDLLVTCWFDVAPPLLW